MSIEILPLTAVYSMMAGFAIVAYLAFQHGLPASTQQPAESAKDYTPVFYVTVATITMFYIFLFNQSKTVFSEFNKLKTAYKEKKTEKAPELGNLKYGKDNVNILAADRAAGNFMEQMIPFLVALFGYATFVSVAGAVQHGWAWLFFRSYYLTVFKMPFPTLFLSTLPAYACIFSMIATTTYVLALTA